MLAELIRAELESRMGCTTNLGHIKRTADALVEELEAKFDIQPKVVKA